jgi:hypothetical protein
MATANPAMNEAVYRRAGLAATPTQAMTIQGSVLKTAFLVLILLVTAAYTWSQAVAGSTTVAYGLLIAGLIGGFLTALVTIFIPRVSPFTAPIYAALEGLVLGAISAVFETMYPGIVIQAVGLTVGVLAVTPAHEAAGIRPPAALLRLLAEECGSTIPFRLWGGIERAKVMALGGNLVRSHGLERRGGRLVLDSFANRLGCCDCRQRLFAINEFLHARISNTVWFGKRIVADAPLSIKYLSPGCIHR